MPVHKGETGQVGSRRTSRRAPTAVAAPGKTAMSASALAAPMLRDHGHPAIAGTIAPALPVTHRRHSRMNGSGGGLSAERRPGPEDTAPLYSWFARLYDGTTGFAAYPVVRDAVERSITRYQPFPSVAADVGCGTGLLLPYLASVASRVYAVDRSPSMLRLARARSCGLPVTLLRQDLRRLALPEPANLITCTFDTLNYLLSAEDLLLALERFRRNLAAGGVFLFDLVTGAAWRDAPLRIVQRLRQRDFAATWRIHNQPARRLSIVDMRLTGARPPPANPCQREVHVQRWHSLDLVRDLARRADLRIREIRDLDTDRAATEGSHWVHVIATRASRD